MPTNRPETAIISTESTPAKYTCRTLRRKRKSDVPECASICSRNRQTLPSACIKPRVFAPTVLIRFIFRFNCFFRRPFVFGRPSENGLTSQQILLQSRLRRIAEGDGAVGQAADKLAHPRRIEFAHFLGRAGKYHFAVC